MKMKRNRFWIEIIGLGSAIAFVLALLIATLGAALSFTGEPAVGQEIGMPAPSQDPSLPSNPSTQSLPSGPQLGQVRTYEGVVTCSQCGAKHSPKMGQSAADCTRSCVHSGGSFSLVDGEKTYRLEGDLNLLKKVAGERARVVGVAHGNTIQVTSLDAA
jgi:hypothetical protein